MKNQKPLIELELNVPQTIEVFANQRLNYTDLMLRKDQRYDFQVLPPDQTWIDSKLEPFTAEGRKIPLATVAQPALRMPKATWFALIGSVEKKKKDHFEIGIECLDYTPKIDGELICFANDVVGFYKNNSKSIQLTITRVK